MGKVLGIDLGMRNTKISIINTGKTPKIMELHSIITPPGVINDGLIIDPQILGGKIRTFLEKNKIKSKSLSFTINSSQGVVREVRLPAMPDNEIPPAVEFQLSQSFPGISQNHTISSRIFESDEKGIKGIVAFCPNSILETYVETAKVIGVPIKFIDVSSNCVLKAYTYFGRDASDYNSVILVDVGFDSTQVSLVHQGRLILSRFVDGGGQAVDRLISSNMELDMNDAEKVKMGTHPDIRLDEDQFEPYIRLGSIAIEEQIKQAMDFYNFGKFDESISKIILLGSGSKLRGFKEYIEDIFRIDVEYISGDTGDSEKDNIFIEFMPSIGAAIREQEKHKGVTDKLIEQVMKQIKKVKENIEWGRKRNV